MTKPISIDDRIDEIFKVMQNELSDAWERYEGAEYDELDDYGDAYDNAYHKAKQAIALELDKARIDIREALKEQLKAAQTNLKYQIDNTQNKTLISEWTGTVQGIKFCIDAVDKKANLQQGNTHE